MLDSEDSNNEDIVNDILWECITTFCTAKSIDAFVKQMNHDIDDIVAKNITYHAEPNDEMEDKIIKNDLQPDLEAMYKFMTKLQNKLGIDGNNLYENDFKAEVKKDNSFLIKLIYRILAKIGIETNVHLREEIKGCTKKIESHTEKIAKHREEINRHQRLSQ